MGFTRSIIVVFVLFRCGLLVADTQTALSKLPSGCRPISLYSADYDRDGISDLIVKCETFQGTNHYFYRGNADSIYPNSPEATKHKLAGSFNSLPFNSAEGPIDDPKSKSSTEIRLRLNKDSIDDVITLRGDGEIIVQMSAPSLIFTVNSIADPGAGICDAAECTLREAITAANATPAADEIQFNLPGSGPYTISPASKLPIVLQPLTIDATTQPGYSGSPIVELNGVNAGSGADGLEVRANSTIAGLVINRFSAQGLYLSFTGISHIEGNFIGTNISGTSALGNGPAISSNPIW